MPTIEPFPGNVKQIDPLSPNSPLPDGLTKIETADGMLFSAKRTIGLRLPDNSRKKVVLSLDSSPFLPLLAVLKPYEKLTFDICYQSGHKSPNILFSLNNTGDKIENTRLRHDAMSLALDTAIEIAFPNSRMYQPSANDAQDRPFSYSLVPEGNPLPLTNSVETAHPTARLVSSLPTENAVPQEIIFPPVPGDPEGLSLAIKILAKAGEDIKLSLILCHHSFNAKDLRKLYTARSSLSEKTTSDFLEKGKLPFNEMGGNAYLTALLQESGGYGVTIVVSSKKPLDDSLLSILSFALFGKGKGKSDVQAALDLRKFYPHKIFEESLLPRLLMLIPSVYTNQEESTVEFPENGLLLGQDKAGSEVRINETDRARHIYMIGSTGTGKSTLFANMMLQDINEGKGVILFDPHGDLWNQIRHSIPDSRQDDVVLAHLGDARWSFTTNILAGQGGDPAIERNTVVNTLIDLFKKVLYQNVPEAFGPMFEIYFRNALLLLMEAKGEQATIMDFERVFDDSLRSYPGEAHNSESDLLDPFRVLRFDDSEDATSRMTFREHLLLSCDNEKLQDFWKMADNISGHNDISLKNIAPYIVCKLTQITGSPLLAPVLGSTESSLDFQDIMAKGKICLINLAKGEVGAKDASFTGGLLSIRMAMAAQARSRLPEDQRPVVNVYMDEFQTYATDMLSDMMSEVRKYGLHMVLANQTLSQIDGGHFRANAAGGVLGNAANMIAFRVGIPDAEQLAKWFSPDFTAEDLAQLPDFTTISRILAKGRPVKAMKFNTLPFDKG